MKNYYDILGLRESATDADIRRAFRKLVKQFHPDHNASPDASLRFIEIQEAYKTLSDPVSRDQYIKRYGRRHLSADELRRRETIYREWIKHQPIAKQEESANTKDVFSFFSWKKINIVVNLLFFIFCLVVIFVPIWKYVEQQNLPVDQQKPAFAFIIPAITGLLFAGWGYYYWFVMKSDEL